mgnify:CR=1 FL=1
MSTWLDDNVPTLHDAVELANKLLWEIAIIEKDNNWYVYSGEVALLCAQTKEAAESFVYGMAAAYKVLPAETLQHVLADYGLDPEVTNSDPS